MPQEILQRLLERPLQSHKYDFGHVLIVGGATGMSGAPVLSALAALRAGAGLVTIGTPAGRGQPLTCNVPEIMVTTIETVEQLQHFVEERKVSVVAIGPGLRPLATLRDHLSWLVTSRLKLVIDGGALGSLRDHLQILSNSTADRTVLTPHTGEFQQLLGKDLPADQPALRQHAEQFVQQYPVTLVLKGHPTFVTAPAAEPYENNTGNPGMATAGSGDVLAGIIGALLAQGLGTYQAAMAAVYLHGLAGDLAARAKTQPGMIASDLIKYLPAAWRRVGHQ